LALGVYQISAVEVGPFCFSRREISVQSPAPAAADHRRCFRGAEVEHAKDASPHPGREAGRRYGLWEPSAAARCAARAPHVPPGGYPLPSIGALQRCGATVVHVCTLWRSGGRRFMTHMERISSARAGPSWPSQACVQVVNGGRCGGRYGERCGERCGDGASAPKLLSAGRSTCSSKHFSRDGASARNYLLQDVPHLRVNTFSGMERQPPNYSLQDVPHLRANPFFRDGASAPKLLAAGRSTSSSKHFFRDGGSAPKLLAAKRSTSSSKHFFRDGASAPKLLVAGRATFLGKHDLRDGASAPKLLSAGHATSPGKHFFRDGALAPK